MQKTDKKAAKRHNYDSLIEKDDITPKMQNKIKFKTKIYYLKNFHSTLYY